MTKKEKMIEMISIAFCAWEEEYGGYDDWSEEHEARDAAIKALEQEPCEDAISRRAVLDTLDKMDSVLDENRTVETYKELLAACYKDLPSVTSVYKGGEE